MLTIEDIKDKLASGEEEDYIRREFFKSVGKDFREMAFADGGTEFNFDRFRRRMSEIGFPIDISNYREGWRKGRYYDIHLNNMTVELFLGTGSYITFSPDGTGWYLSQFDADKTVDALLKADESYPDILATWASYERECKKFRMIRELSENAIKDLVREKLRGTGLEYSLEMEPTAVIMKVKMKRARYFEVKLPHDHFSDILTDALIGDIRNVASLLDGIKYNCRIARYGNNMNWHKSE